MLEVIKIESRILSDSEELNISFLKSELKKNNEKIDTLKRQPAIKAEISKRYTSKSDTKENYMDYTDQRKQLYKWQWVKIIEIGKSHNYLTKDK